VSEPHEANATRASDPHAPNATIVQRRDVNERVTIFHVQPDGGRIVPFVPGQFVQLGLPADLAAPPTPSDPPARTKLVKRSYSIASAPRETGAYELCIAFVDEGKLSNKLRALHAGHRLWHDPVPKGIFTLEKIPDGLDLVDRSVGGIPAPAAGVEQHLAVDLPAQPLRERRRVRAHELDWNQGGIHETDS